MKIPQNFRKIPEISLKNTKFYRKFPKKFSPWGGLASPDRGAFPKNFFTGGVLAIPPCSPLYLI